ncbi:hypothetical protein BJF93_13760 [Xaviernesmea oryzae]|uniref:Alpha-L-rhamnosidase n=1 Tax=Xaviernesmea oryzae TaxID=464029 RepID=A0A1Q9AR42_9HYPH|nr:hypothetical protein BJF93_13760 [Xaviernesmea oryzae]
MRGVALSALMLLSPGTALSNGLAHHTPNPAALLPDNLVPENPEVCPVKVVSVKGTVSDADALLCDGVMGATIDVAPGSKVTVVLDYGRNVGGIPFFDVGAVTGSVDMKAAYAETNRYLSENGDGAAPPAQSLGTGEGDPRRYDVYTVTKPGLITNYDNQGGERYQQLTFTGSGSITLNRVGIKYIADRTQPVDYGGYFSSSDDVLNRIWYAGAYTAQLGSVPARSMPGGFRIVSGAMEARGASNLTAGSDIGYYMPGKDWADYTVTMQVKIVSAQAGWAVRAQDPRNGLVFLLDKSGQLRALTAIDNAYKTIASATVPFPIVEGKWYDVTTTVRGKVATVSINGSLVLTADASAFSKGSIGFREYSGEAAQFRKVVVSNGAKLNLPFDKAADLADFWIPGSNERAAILDGAKRDRLIWSGDIDIAGPSIAYSLGNNDYLKGSLQQMATRQHTSGFIEGAVPATYPTIPAKNLTSETGPYSATYSMYVVLGAYDHLLFSGDYDFAKTMWPIVQKQMAWNATRLDQRGLFVTRRQDGADWDFYDAEKVGAITAYNAIYYRTLLSAAAMADALGEAADADDYRSQADKLGQAINRYMYNPQKGYYKISDTVDIIAQDANAAALFAGLAPAEEVPRVLASMKSLLWTTKYGPLPFGDRWWKPIVSTFISGYEAQARFAHDDTENAETLIRNVYGWMVNPDNPDMTSTLWENVAVDGKPGLGSYTSLAHGWATGAVSALSGYVLGVRPLSPGFKTWLVQPHIGKLDRAEGRVPTPAGPIDVQWNQGDGQLSLTVEAPQGTKGRIGIPMIAGADATVLMDGRIIWQDGHAAERGAYRAVSDGNFLYVSDLPGGTHMVVLSN